MIAVTLICDSNHFFRKCQSVACKKGFFPLNTKFMKLPAILRQGFFALLYLLFGLFPLLSSAQKDDDNKKIDRYVYKIRFEVSNNTGLTIEQCNKIKSIQIWLQVKQLK